MKYFNFKRYKFSTILKDINLRRYNFFKLINPAGLDYKKIYKYINTRTFDVTKLTKNLDNKIFNLGDIFSRIKIKKIVKSKFWFIHLPASIIFFVFLYLSIPMLYNYDQLTIENKLCKNKNVQCVIKGKIKYMHYINLEGAFRLQGAPNFIKFLSNLNFLSECVLCVSRFSERCN